MSEKDEPDGYRGYNNNNNNNNNKLQLGYHPVAVCFVWLSEQTHITRWLLYPKRAVQSEYLKIKFRLKLLV